MAKGMSLSISGALLFGATLLMMKAGTPDDYGDTLSGMIAILCIAGVLGMTLGLLITAIAALREL